MARDLEPVTAEERELLEPHPHPPLSRWILPIDSYARPDELAAIAARMRRRERRGHEDVLTETYADEY
jgi:hypothetical protein